MNGIGDLLPIILGAALTFGICLGVARAGHVRTAWWLPAGIAALTAAFVFLGLRLGSDAGQGTGSGVVRSVLLLGVPAILAGILGIVLGRPRK